MSTASGGYADGILANQNLTVGSTAITVDNTSSAVTGVTYGIFGGSGIFFEGEQSTVSVSSSTPSSSQVIYSGGVVVNNSTPKSQCSVNGGASSNCA